MELEILLAEYWAKNKKRLDFVQQELKKCCEGRLFEEKQDGHAHFIQTFYEDGKRIRRGLNRKPELIESLVRKRALEDEIKILLEEQRVLASYKDVLGTYATYDLTEEVKLLKDQWPSLAEDFIIKAICQTPDADWEQASYEQSDYKPEMRNTLLVEG